MSKFKKYFSPFEIGLWCSSVSMIIISFCIFDREGYMNLSASLIGVTALIFCAKGNPVGQLLMVIFGILYGIISFAFSYYGEMITYMGMTVPMAIFALISWLKNPYGEGKSEVKVNRIDGRETVFAVILTIVVTVVFYFILDAFGTASILPSTISVTTSFFAVYLSFRRSPYFALAYAANDVILIILWTLVAINDISYMSVIICFVVFLANDLYSFFNWLKMQKRQEKE